MLKQAYEYGILLALQEEGFIKEAGATHGIKAVAEATWQGIRNYFTGKGVRNALDEFAGARSKAQELLGKGVPIPKPAVLEESLAEEIPKGLEAARNILGKARGSMLDPAKVDVLSELLAKAQAGVQTPVEKAIIEYAAKKKNLLRSFIPYAAPAAIGAGAAALPSAMGSIYPNL